MPTYYEFEDGSLKSDASTYIPVGHRLYVQAQEEVARGDSDILPYEAPAPSPREVRDAALKNLVHDFGDGRVMQVRPVPFASDEANIRNAMERMTRLGETSIAWMMADDTVANVTADELQTALESGQDQGAQIWATFLQSQGS